MLRVAYYYIVLVRTRFKKINRTGKYFVYR